MPFLTIAFATVAAAAIASNLAWPDQFWPYALLKPLATVLVMALAWRRAQRGDGRGHAVLAGLGLSLLGDVALLWPQQGFVPGLVAFLLAHLAYLWAFTRGQRLAVPAWPFAAYAVVAAAVLWLLWPGVPAALQLPVLAYVCALAAMAAQAASRWRARRGGEHGGLAGCAAAGGALFMLSDALLATNRFHSPLPLASLWILASYWAAQWLIALSLPPGSAGAGVIRSHP